MVGSSQYLSAEHRRILRVPGAKLSFRTPLTSHVHRGPGAIPKDRIDNNFGGNCDGTPSTVQFMDV
ncbi:MAG: hypothetical protein ACJLS3_06430 [Erythrobacter sp.]